METRKIYEYALQREYEGKRFFEQNADRLSHAAAIEAFRQLAAEEQKHIEFIQAQLDAMDRGERSNPEVGLEMERAGFFSQRAASESIDQSVLEAMVPDLAVLRLAYLIERDFSEFYEMAAEDADRDAQVVLRTLAQWERRHERLFRNMHDQAFQEYAHMPWGG